jgi:hypothetical protein
MLPAQKKSSLEYYLKVSIEDVCILFQGERGTIFSFLRKVIIRWSDNHIPVWNDQIACGQSDTENPIYNVSLEVYQRRDYYFFKPGEGE